VKKTEDQVEKEQVQLDSLFLTIEEELVQNKDEKHHHKKHEHKHKHKKHDRPADESNLLLEVDQRLHAHSGVRMIDKALIETNDREEFMAKNGDSLLN